MKSKQEDKELDPIYRSDRDVAATRAARAERLATAATARMVGEARQERTLVALESIAKSLATLAQAGPLHHGEEKGLQHGKNKG